MSAALVNRPSPSAPNPTRGAFKVSVLELERLIGLREEEAHARLQQEGANGLPPQRKRNLLNIALEVVREPMFLMLVGAGALYLFMGELVDALMLLGFVFVVVTITIVQERRTERALDALRDLASPRALVIRDGARRRIAGRDVVRGDLVVIAEGDRVAADGLLRQALHVSTDESLLTGESVPVRKALDKHDHDAGRSRSSIGALSPSARASSTVITNPTSVAVVPKT